MTNGAETGYLGLVFGCEKAECLPMIRYEIPVLGPEVRSYPDEGTRFERER